MPSGTAEPPQTPIRSDEMSRPGLAWRYCSTSFQIVGTARGDRRASLFDHVDQRCGLQEPVRQQQVGAGHQRRVRLTPGVGVEHRDDRQDAVAVGEANPLAAQTAIECR